MKILPVIVMIFTMTYLSKACLTYKYKSEYIVICNDTIAYKLNNAGGLKTTSYAISLFTKNDSIFFLKENFGVFYKYYKIAKISQLNSIELKVIENSKYSIPYLPMIISGSSKLKNNQLESDIGGNAIIKFNSYFDTMTLNLKFVDNLFAVFNANLKLENQGSYIIQLKSDHISNDPLKFRSTLKYYFNSEDLSIYDPVTKTWKYFKRIENINGLDDIYLE